MSHLFYFFMYFVYALYSKKFDKIYVGYSENPEKRLFAHNDQRNKGWTKKYQPWIIIHLEKFESKTDALKREKQLKTSKGRSFIRAIVNQN